MNGVDGELTVHQEAQEFERGWWGDCVNTFGEEAKQISYAHRMGLKVLDDGTGRWPVYDLCGKSVLDIGGGPSSMLLKTINGGERVVADPCTYPAWVRSRYEEAGIRWILQGGEDVEFSKHAPSFDECWIYNCLQHVVDPEQVILRAKANAKLLRIFEWIEHPACEGHPHTLHADVLNEWVGGAGHIENMNENGCVGLAWYGVFAT